MIDFREKKMMYLRYMESLQSLAAARTGPIASSIKQMARWTSKK